MLLKVIRRLRFAPFLGGSVLCAAINNAILIAGDHLGFGYVLLIVVCYATSSSVGYAYHCRITFDRAMTWPGYFKFVVGIWLGLPVALALVAVMIEWLKLPMWFTAPAMTLVMFIYHYVIARLAITAPLQTSENV